MVVTPIGYDDGGTNDSVAYPAARAWTDQSPAAPSESVYLPWASVNAGPTNCGAPNLYALTSAPAIGTPAELVTTPVTVAPGANVMLPRSRLVVMSVNVTGWRPSAPAVTRQEPAASTTVKLPSVGTITGVGGGVGNGTGNGLDCTELTVPPVPLPNSSTSRPVIVIGVEGGGGGGGVNCRRKRSCRWGVALSIVTRIAGFGKYPGALTVNVYPPSGALIAYAPSTPDIAVYVVFGRVVEDNVTVAKMTGRPVPEVDTVPVSGSPTALAGPPGTKANVVATIMHTARIRRIWHTI